MRPFSQIAAALVAALLTLPCLAAPVDTYRIIARYPHPTDSYTEGLFYLNGLFYESTGLKGRSSILAIQPETGKTLQHYDLPSQYFREGVVDWGRNTIGWTWQTHTGFVYDRFTLAVINVFHYAGEGWGMTHNATELITSDGTATLRFRNP